MAGAVGGCQCSSGIPASPCSHALCVVCHIALHAGAQPRLTLRLRGPGLCLCPAEGLSHGSSSASDSSSFILHGSTTKGAWAGWAQFFTFCKAWSVLCFGSNLLEAVRWCKEEGNREPAAPCMFKLHVQRVDFILHKLDGLGIYWLHLLCLVRLLLPHLIESCYPWALFT